MKSHAFHFIGCPGSGKTYLVEQACARYAENIKPRGVLYWKFSCLNADNLLHDIEAIYLALGIRIQINHAPFMSPVKKLCLDINQRFPDLMKLFIFDDAGEQHQAVVDELCGGTTLSQSWKILVTHGIQPPQTLPNIGRDNIIALGDLKFLEAKGFFHGFDIEDEDIKTIVKTLGSLPLTLHITLEYLKDNQVGNIIMSIL